MSLPKTGTRKVVVDGEPFRWLIRRKATYNQWSQEYGCLHVAVEHAEQPHSTLIIWTDKPHPKFWGNFQKQSVSPSEVSAYIHQAIEAGWQPLQNGATFIVKISGEDLQRVNKQLEFVTAIALYGIRKTKNP